MKNLELVITDIENKIKWQQEDINKLVAEIKADTANYNDYDIITFIPGKIARLQEIRNRRDSYTEQLRMLQFIQS